MSFLDIRFPESISTGSTGGPGFSTDVVVFGNGDEQRNANWGDFALCEFDVSHAVNTKSQIKDLVIFFRMAQGRANTFRYKDWMDYGCLITEGILGLTGIGTGELAYQGYKKYSNAAGDKYRKLILLVSGTPIIKRNGSAVTVGASPGNIAINLLTGIVTFVPDVTKNVNANSAKTITGISQAANGRVTATGHGFVTGDKIKITGVVGMTQINNLYFTITYDDADHFLLNVDTSAYTAWSSAGTATKYGITQTSPARVYSTGHGFTNGQLIFVSGSTGMTQVNGLAYTVANASTDYFDLYAINATAYGAYSGSGVLSKGPQPADALTISCEFDIKARFGIDKLIGGMDSGGDNGPEIYSWNQIPIVETRR